ncbi:hypothetical protein [Streptomyces roseicoloratus]|uniref:Polysaccharide chain length determinant N-terminal domain-containing protein n=1 Tax=Streptomyces roseicoloratus TaxID=2508722 RepID=A0ABY9S213_9ACTN|nr:hypothetical protein [Streptomyces roseicoloratus]WMX48350.1 hypothetical protein RGF97_31065 [Streptomyces roseicoloratus]
MTTNPSRPNPSGSHPSRPTPSRPGLRASAAVNGTPPAPRPPGDPAVGGVPLRDLLRWWPLVVLTTLAALLASAVMAWGPQDPAYRATTRMPVTPLAQSDETFVGTGLVRDAGDADRTSSTVARLLDSDRVAAATAQALGAPWTPASVRAAVDVKPVDETNLIEVTARADQPGQAVRVAETFAQTALDDRWRTISAELDRRIAFARQNTDADPNAGEESRRLQLLTFVRENGVDPTLSIDSTGPAVRVGEVPAGVITVMAAAGGMFLGVLAAYGIERHRRRPRSEDEGADGDAGANGDADGNADGDVAAAAREVPLHAPEPLSRKP